MHAFFDRRKTPRVETAFKVELLDGSTWLFAQDISLGGMLVTTHQVRWPGQILRLRFRLPGQSRYIRATCRVVDILEVPHGVGLSLHFLRLHATAQTAILNYVDQRKSQYDGTCLHTRAIGFIKRIIEDCAQLKAFARP